MTLKRNPAGDGLSSSINDGLNSETEEIDTLGSFSSFSKDESVAQAPLELDAFAPYKPAEGSLPEQSAIGAFESPVPPAPVIAPIDPKPLSSFDDISDFNSFADDTFGAGLQALHASPTAPADYAFGDPEPVGAKSFLDFEPLAPPTTASVSVPDVPLAFSAFDDDLGISPAPPSAVKAAQLTVKAGKLTAAYEIDKPTLSIGRTDIDTNCVPDVAVDLDDAVSRRHAIIVHVGTSDYIEDAGSTNGTKLNGKLIQPNERQLLNNGDLIQIGTAIEILYSK